jgi:signal transduction histidine kinase
MPSAEAPPEKGRSRGRNHWGTLILLAVGALSLLLLIWTRELDERRAEDAGVVTAVMELRIHSAIAQLLSERAVSGRDRDASLARVEPRLRDAARLARVLAAEPPDDPTARGLTPELERLTAEWIATRDPAAFERLQAVASELERVVDSEQATDIIKTRRLFPWLLVAWTAIVAGATRSVFRRESDRLAVEDALRSGHERLEEMVADRTSSLRSVHMALLNAQETERKRISTELHDQLGHALILLKFRIALVGRELNTAQDSAKRACAELCAFVDQTLDDVRRLARDLRPSVLDALGLTAALRWIAENSGHDDASVSAAIEDVDALVPRDAQVVVYRIVQQALTNAARHSLAKNISLRVASHDECVSFVVEDDGEGFDTTKLATGPAAGALGLTTMQERASIIGGSLTVWSAPGSGTRVTLGVPVPIQETK